MTAITFVVLRLSAQRPSARATECPAPECLATECPWRPSAHGERVPLGPNLHPRVPPSQTLFCFDFIKRGELS